MLQNTIVPTLKYLIYKQTIGKFGVFMRKWNIEDIPDLSGNVVIVTGGNSGLGYETVRVSAMRGAEVVMASRNLERGREAIDKITKKNPDAKISLMQLDMADLLSVERFADEFMHSFNGITFLPREYTVDGFEKHFGTNHLGHFALTGRL